MQKNTALCRGKRLDKADEWVYGYYVRLNENTHRIYGGYATLYAGSYYVPEYWDVDPETVGWCSGATDKNEKPIYADDIVKIDVPLESGANICVCRWDEGNFEFSVANKTESIGLAYVAPSGIEVIGNVHDHPYLLRRRRNSKTNKED